MQFQYQAKTSSGEMMSGVIDSESLADARKSLRDDGMFVLDLVTGKQGSTPIKMFGNRPTGKRVRKADLLMFTTQLTIMCQSGIDLAEALQSVASQCTNPVLKRTLDEIYGDVADGKSVSVALGKHTHIFGNAYVASVAAGEASGTLVDILVRLSDLLRNEIRLRNTLTSVLSYPCVLTGVATLVIGAMIFFVLPQFATVFEDLGKPPPPMTQLILGMGKAVRENIIYLAIGMLVCAAGAYRFWLSETAKKWRDQLLLNGLLIKTATRPLLTGRTFRLLGTMLQSGIPLLEAIRLCRSSVKNSLFNEMYNSLEQEILNGCGIGKTLARYKFIPAGAAQMVMTAEQTGKLGEVSETIGEFYETEGEEKIAQLSKMLEPAIIVVMGAIVAFVMLSIMLPLLDVSTMSS